MTTPRDRVRVPVAAALAACWWLSVPGAFAQNGTEKPVPAAPPAAQPAPAAPADPFVLDHRVKTIDGADIDLVRFRGSVVLVVNVASKCGLTPQYEALEKLYASRKDKGLVILAFPANNFGAQEPGTNAEIKRFCSDNYAVSFPMFAKVSVKGDDRDPFFTDLVSRPAPLGGEPKWNFTKFLLDRSGNVVARFEPRTAPDDPALLKQLDELLAAPAPAATPANPSVVHPPAATPEKK